MPRTIEHSVGAGGANRPADVRTIQEMLNRVPHGWGGPQTALRVDGNCGPLTIAAIRRFQQIQLGSVFSPDGRVDPARYTLRRLNHIWDSPERPGGTFHLSREPIDHVRQPTNMTCWAAAGTMLCSARDRVCRPIEAVMRMADAADPTYNYLQRFQNNLGLPPQDTSRYTRAIGLSVGPRLCLTVSGWRRLMSQHGAIGVVGLTPGLHIRVITEIHGDGSVFGTFFTVHDPGMSRPYSEAFVTFSERYEAAATVNDRMDQLWYA